MDWQGAKRHFATIICTLSLRQVWRTTGHWLFSDSSVPSPLLLVGFFYTFRFLWLLWNSLYQTDGVEKMLQLVRWWNCWWTRLEGGVFKREFYLLANIVRFNTFADAEKWFIRIIYRDLVSFFSWAWNVEINGFEVKLMMDS